MRKQSQRLTEIPTSNPESEVTSCGSDSFSGSLISPCVTTYQPQILKGNQSSLQTVQQLATLGRQ